MRLIWKLILAAAVLALAAFLVMQLPPVRKALGKRGFETAIRAGVGTSALADLPEGLHIALAGTGSPMSDETRAGQGTVIIAGKRIFVVDAGSGSPKNIALMGIPVGEIERVFLTHLHSDHIDGLGELMLQRWANGARLEPLPVHGPAGVEQVVAGFNLAYGPDRGFRIAHHGEDIVPPGGFGGRAETILPAGPGEFVVYDEGGVRVTAVGVQHAPVEGAVGYRFDYAGRSVTLSGDTAYSEDLARLAEGSDVLVHETLNTDMVSLMEEVLTEAGRPNLAQIMADIPSYHATPVEAAEVARLAGVKALVFSHIIPPVPTRFLNAYYLDGVSDVFGGKVVLGEDGMLVSLPSGSDRIAYGDLQR